MQHYSDVFYAGLKEGARRSAEGIVPLILEWIQPKSVVDVGCGDGAWLAVFKERGVEDILGIDGDHVNRERLEIPTDRFMSLDLSQPVRLDRQFDLVLSLEVAEHLPAERAELYIDSLTHLGPIVLFSAAIPFQGGTLHVNEQWPEYWVQLFEKKQYFVIDCVRKQVWRNTTVEWWYAQNILMFGNSGALQNCAPLRTEYELTRSSLLSVVHPRRYLEALETQNALLETVWTLQTELTNRDIVETIPPGRAFILVDQGKLTYEPTAGRSAIPFLEKDGHYWGPPPDDSTAILELERLRETGAIYMVFVWPAFWWLDYYVELNCYLQVNFRCVLQNERLVVFDLSR